MDYGAITSCETEYSKAVCLCGSHKCRESFMTFTGSRALHEVLRGFGPLMTFKTLIQVTGVGWGGEVQGFHGLLGRVPRGPVSGALYRPAPAP